MYLIDSHCHLNLIKSNGDNIKNILKNAYKNSIKLILNVSTSVNDYIKSLRFLKEKNKILFSCGIHPLDHSIHDTKNIKKLKNILSKKHYISALGETGLDFYRNDNTKNIQIKTFKKHIDLSIKYNIPIIIHTRNAEYDTIKILSKQEYLPCSGVIHSFTGDVNMARKLLDLGFYISLSGIITFKNALYLKKVAKFIPEERLLIETDSPYLSPEPYRGHSNQPSNLLYIAQHIAELRNISILDLSRSIKKNFYSLFHLNK